MNLTRRDFLEACAGGVIAAQVKGLSGAGLKDPDRVSWVESIHGVPTFFCEGRPVLVPAFETYVPTRHYFEQFAQAGTQVFGFSANAAACDYGHSSPTWMESDAWDYSQFDQRAAAVLDANPDAWLLPRVNLGTPRWWLQQHPEALELFDDGSTIPSGANPTLPKDRPFPSLASTPWRLAVGDALKRLIQHVQKSRFGPRIFGWCLSGLHTEEFYHWACSTERLAGYSTPTRDAFRQWLGRKYPSVSALRRAWGREDVDFDSVTMPTRQERLDIGDGVFRGEKQRNIIDFYLFWNELIPETLDYFAGMLKEADANRHVVGAFYGYLYEFVGDPEFGHNAMGLFLASQHLDFMAVTASYFTRQSAQGGDYARSPAASVRLHGKVWYHDNDAASFRTRQILEAAGWKDNDPDWTRNLSVQLPSLGYTPTAEASRWMYQRGFGFAMCQGMAGAWFDLHGGYFDAPQLMEEIAQLNRLAAQAASWDRSSIAEILVVADEGSCAWCRPRSPFLRELLLTPQNSLLRIGAPVDHVLLADLEILDTKQYKWVIFLNCFRVTLAQRRTIARKLKCDGKHLLWCSGAGWFSDDKASADQCRDLTGFELVRSTDGKSPFCLSPGASTSRPGSPENSAEIYSKEESGWTSLWSRTAALSPAEFRTMAHSAGVHIFNEQDDVLYACRSLICLHARTDGQRVLTFPEAIHLRDAVTGHSLGTAVKHWRHEFRAGQTRLLCWQSGSS